MFFWKQKANTMSSISTDFNMELWKGSFVEMNIYDYFEDKGYITYLVSTSNGQRMSHDNSIIVPDLLIEDRYNEFFFIESKSSWEHESNPIFNPSFRIEKYKMNSYLKFYNTVFPKRKLEGFSSLYVDFVTCSYDNNFNGALYSNMCKFENLVNISWWEENGFICWNKSDIKNNSTNKFIVRFNHMGNYVFKTKFTNDVIGKHRNKLKITKEWIDEQVGNWENQTWSW